MENTQENNDTNVEQLQVAVQQLQEQLAQLLNTRMAKGTRDLTKQAQEAVAQVVEESLDLKIENLIRKESLSVRQISKTLAATEPDVQEALLRMRRGRKVWNIGSPEFPLWTFRIGDRTTVTELVSLVKRLISEKPMSTAEIARATGARYTRADGAVIAIRRADENADKILNLGTARSGKWFLLTEKATSARLENKE